MAGKIKGITIEIGGNTTKLDKALKQVNNTSRDLTSQLKDINKSLKFNPGNTELIAQKQRVLSEAVGNTKDKLNTLKDAHKQASKQLADGKIGKDAFDELTREIIISENELKRFQGQLNSLNRETSEQAKTMNDLKKSISDVSENTQKTSNELDNLNKALKLDPKNVELTAQKQKLLKDNIEKATIELKNLENKQQEVNRLLNSGKISESEYQNLTIDIQSAKKELQDFQKVAKQQTGFGDKATKLENKGKQLTDVGKNLAPLSVASGGLLVKGAKEAISFESAMAGVSKTVNLTSEEFKQMRQEILNMSNELPATAQEIAGVVEGAGQLGIQKENLLSFTKTMIDLGESTNLSSDNAATSLSRFANITQMSQQDFDKLGSTIVGLGNNFATTEAEIVEMGMRLAGTGSQIGLTQGEIMGLATAMSSVGIEAEAGGSSMSSVMNKINNAVAVGGKRVEEFSKIAGMTSAEFSNAWKTKPTKALTSFINGLKRIQDEGGNVNIELKKLKISGIRETDTLNRLSGAGNLLNNTFTMSNSLFAENTALTNEASQRYATTESKIAMLKNTFTEMAVEIGEEVLPILRILADGLKVVMNGFNGLPDGVKKGIVVLLALVTALAPLLIIIGKVSIGISALIKTFSAVLGSFGALTGVLGAVGSALGSVGGFLLSLLNPITAVIAIVGILIGVFVALYQNNEDFRNKVNAIWDSIKNAVKSAVDFMIGLFNGFINFLKSIPQKISGFWDSVKGIFKTGLEFIKALIKVYIDGYIGVWKFLFNGIKTIATNICNTVKDVFDNLLRGIKKILSNTGDALKKYISKFTEIGKDIVNGIKNGIVNGAKALYKKASEIAYGILNTIKSTLGIHSPSLKMKQEVGRNIVLGIVEGINDNKKTAIKCAGDLSKDLVNASKTFTNKKYEDDRKRLIKANSKLEQIEKELAKNRLKRYKLEGKKEELAKLKNENAMLNNTKKNIKKQIKQISKAMNEYDKAVFTSKKNNIINHTQNLLDDISNYEIKNKKIHNEKMAELQSVFENVNDKKLSDNKMKNLEKHYKKFIDEQEKEQKKLNNNLLKIENDLTKNKNMLRTKETKLVLDNNKKILEASKKMFQSEIKNASEYATYLKSNFENLKENYNKAFEDILNKQNSMTDKLKNFGDLMRVIQNDDGTESYKLNDIQLQIDLMTKYGSILSELQRRGADIDIIEKVANMDVETGVKLGELLVNQTQGELERLSRQFEIKRQIAENIASKYYEKDKEKLNKIYDEKMKKIANDLSNDMENANNKTSEALNKSVDIFLKNVVKKVKGIESIISNMKISIPSLEKYSFKKISYHANGVIFKKPTLLGGSHIVGEAGAEAVIPLSKLDDIVVRSMQKVGSSSNITLNVNISGNSIREDKDIDMLVDKMYKELGKRLERKKRGLGLVGV